VIKGAKGFTLVETLITVAVIGVLVAVGIPLYNHYSAAAHSSACAHNRAALQSSVTVALLDNKKLTAAELTKIIADDGANSSAVCPDGGTYSVAEDENGNMNVVCSVHSGTSPSAPSHTMTAVDVVTTLNNAYNQLGLSASAKTVINSGAGTYDKNTKAVADIIGTSLTDQDVQAWTINQYNTSTIFFNWTTYDINNGTFSENDIVPVMQYRSDTGVYSVWLTYLQKKTATVDGKTETYLVLAMPNGSNVTKNISQFADALKYSNANNDAFFSQTASSKLPEYTESINTPKTDAKKKELSTAVGWYNDLLAALKGYNPALYG
jgi:prepilin-type N-terminal cleavage/methylation domain-containing protein